MTRELPAELACHLAELLQRTRRRYRKRLERCQKDFSATAVHELRVETRRALALIDLITALDLPGSRKKPRRVLKERLDAFDELRDAQVELLIISPLLHDFPEARDLEGFLRRRERELVGDLRREIRDLKSRRVERMLKSLEKEVKNVEDKTSQSAGTALKGPIMDAFNRVVAFRKKADRHDTETIHCTRIAFKRFRYLCELLRPLVPGMTAARLREMHEWQTQMGDIQDVEVLLHQMERAVKREEVRLASVKRLHEALAQRLVVLVNHFINTADALDRFRPGPVRRRTTKRKR